MAESHPIEREYAVALSLWGWICLLARATAITFKMLFKFAWAVIGGKRRRNGHSIHKYIAYEGMRDYQYGLSAVGIQNLLPSTRWMARHFAKRHRIPFAEVHLRDGTTAFRLGAGGSGRSAAAGPAPRKVVVMFHGGGYMGPALAEHIKLACGFATKLPDGVAVYILQYGLANETTNQYPRQLQQATVLLDYLVNAENIQPAAITLVGDSAGGHLALSLLLHLAHPCASVPPLSLHGQRLAGAALLSPWIITAGRGEGLVQENEANDVLHADALDYWAQNFLGPSDTVKQDPWRCPLTTPGNWWADLPVDDLFVTYGENEVLCDNIAQFCSALLLAQTKREGPVSDNTKTKMVSAKGYADEMHVHMVMNRLLRLNEPCQSEKDFLAWYAAQLAPASTSTDTSAAPAEK